MIESRRSIDTGTDTVRAEIVDGVGIVTLNRPDRRNALHPEMFDAVPIVLEQYESEDAVGCILITGAGTSFCAGGDVRDGRRRRDDQDPPTSPGAALAHDARMVPMLHSSAKITIAALPGPAVGAGIGIALAADLRIAARSARIVPGWSDLAFSGDFGGAWLLHQYLGASRALEIMVENITLDAVECERLGLFNRVVDDDALPGAALDWARKMAARPRLMARLVKANIADAGRMALNDFIPIESDRMSQSADSDEHRAAVSDWLARAAAKRLAKTSDSGDSAQTADDR